MCVLSGVSLGHAAVYILRKNTSSLRDISSYHSNIMKLTCENIALTM